MQTGSVDQRPYRNVQRVGRKGWTHQQTAAHGDLMYWGSRYTLVLLSTGYAPFSPFAGLLEGRCETFRDKILYPHMNERSWEINLRVWGIRPVEYSWALVARYALPARDDYGEEFSPGDIAGALGCTVHAYYHRINRGRDAYRKNLFTIG